MCALEFIAAICLECLYFDFIKTKQKIRYFHVSTQNVWSLRCWQPTKIQHSPLIMVTPFHSQLNTKTTCIDYLFYLIFASLFTHSFLPYIALLAVVFFFSVVFCVSVFLLNQLCTNSIGVKYMQAFFSISNIFILLYCWCWLLFFLFFVKIRYFVIRNLWENYFFFCRSWLRTVRIWGKMFPGWCYWFFCTVCHERQCLYEQDFFHSTNYSYWPLIAYVLVTLLR